MLASRIALYVIVTLGLVIWFLPRPSRWTLPAMIAMWCAWAVHFGISVSQPWAHLMVDVHVITGGFLTASFLFLAGVVVRSTRKSE